MGEVIVVGGGLAGLSAAHTVLQAGGSVVLLDKNPFMGGNSTKATSGINGGGTRTQENRGVNDSKEQFYEDTVRSATGIKKGDLPADAWYDLAKVLTFESADAVHWIQDRFGLALDVVSRLGGHTNPRTHRSSEGGKFPGMEITYALMQKFEQLAADRKGARLITRARANKLLVEDGKVVGVQYVQGGKTLEVRGLAVILATGGYAAGGLESDSIFKKVRPDLYDKMLPTTNGTHCTGDGITMALEIGGGAVDLEYIQVHPTGLVNPKAPEERTLFLAAEALRGEGGLLLDNKGSRFCNDLGTRDYVSGCMWEHNQAPYRLILNSACAANIAWHCAHYCGRGVMTEFKSGADLAKSMGIPLSALKKTFDEYNTMYRNDSDPWGKKASFFRGCPWSVDDSFMVAIVTPVSHYSMGGVAIDEQARCLTAEGKKVMPGLFAAGEVTGGVHGKNRLGGSALLECVVFGRKAGESVTNYCGSQYGKTAAAGAGVVTISIPQADGTTITVSISGSGVATGASAEEPAKAIAAAPAASTAEYTMEQVAKHSTEKDCWVVVNGLVLDVTTFMHDHPGGKMAIMTFAGRDATEEFK